jgi:hypothetical protein
MKKIGCIAVSAMIFLMSCGGATDGKQETDTTTFQSEQPRPMTDTSSSMNVTDTNNTRTPSVNGAPASSPESRRTTPSSDARDTTKSRQ